MSTWTFGSVRKKPIKSDETNLVERLGEKFGTASMSDVAISRMISEELSLGIELILHWLAAVDILLAAIDDTDESELEWIDTTSENVKSVRASVHEIKFGENPDCTTTLRVDVAR